MNPRNKAKKLPTKARPIRWKKSKILIIYKILRRFPFDFCKIKGSCWGANKSPALEKTNKKKVNKQTHNLCACHFSIMNKWPTNSGCHHIHLDPLIRKWPSVMLVNSKKVVHEFQQWKTKWAFNPLNLQARTSETFPALPRVVALWLKYFQSGQLDSNV